TAVRAAQPPRRRPDPGDLPGPARLLSDRTPGQTSPGPRTDDGRPLSGQPPGAAHRPDDPLPPRRTHPADRQRHRPAHRPDHPRRPTPPPRPPRHRSHPNPLATDLNRWPAKYGTSEPGARAPTGRSPAPPFPSPDATGRPAHSPPPSPPTPARSCGPSAPRP